MPRPELCQSITSATEINRHWYVSDLLYADSGGSIGWNAELQQFHFLATYVDLIQSIPIGMVSCPDSLVWHYDKKGRYTVKSGYYRALADRN